MLLTVPSADDDREPLPGRAEHLGRVVCVAGMAAGCVGAVAVPGAVHLRHQPDVDDLAGEGDRLVEPNHVAVAAAAGDLPRRDQLALAPGPGREAEDAARSRLLPAVERPRGQRRVPVVEVLEHRRVGADLVLEQGHVGKAEPRVGDSVEDLALRRRERRPPLLVVAVVVPAVVRVMVMAPVVMTAVPGSDRRRGADRDHRGELASTPSSPHARRRTFRLIPQGSAPPLGTEDRHTSRTHRSQARPAGRGRTEGVGFEPTRDPEAPNSFQGCRIQPLCHPSVTLVTLTGPGPGGEQAAVA